MFAYWLLYKVAERAEANQSAWHLAIGSWLLIGLIARIYSTNFTLMLRPEDWQSLYENSALGTLLPMSDPTTTPRWIMMLTGGFAVAGIWMVWLSTTSKASETVGAYLNQLGGKIAAVFFVLQRACHGGVYDIKTGAAFRSSSSLCKPLRACCSWCIIVLDLMPTNLSDKSPTKFTSGG